MAVAGAECIGLGERMGASVKPRSGAPVDARGSPREPRRPDRRPGAWRLALLPLLLLLLAGSLGRQGAPSTWERAAGWLTGELEAVELCHVYVESGSLAAGHGAGKGVEISRQGPVAGGLHCAAVTPVASLPRLGAARLDRADAEVFPAARLGGADSAFYRRRLAEAGQETRRFATAPPGGGGEALIVLLHPWAERGRRELAMEPASGRQGFVGELGPVPAGELVSLALRPPHAGERGPELRVAGYPLPLHRRARHPAAGTYLSPRFPVPRLGAEVVLVYPEPLPAGESPSVEVHRWGAVDSRR